MQSSGGVFSSEAARQRPVFMVESGPAAGVIASAHARRAARPPRRPLVRHGRHDRQGRPDPGRAAVGDEGLLRSAGTRRPASAGCRSRATRCGRRSSTWSRSARAAARSPGSTRAGCCASGRRARAPIRGRSATGAAAPSRPSPTRTSCSAGSTPTTSSAARSASTSRARAPRSRSAARSRSASSVVEAANGIVEIANAAMVNALHLISVQRGYDPRDFVLFGFGGAGPVHANALARDAEMPTLLIPRSPGIFSATGLLATDLKRDAARHGDAPPRRARRRPRWRTTFAGLERDGGRRARARGRRRATRSSSCASSTCATSGRASS